MSILRNAYVACLCRSIFPLSTVKFKKCQCPMSLDYLLQCRCRLGSCHSVELKKCPCRPVDFSGLGPYKVSWESPDDFWVFPWLHHSNFSFLCRSTFLHCVMPRVIHGQTVFTIVVELQALFSRHFRASSHIFSCQRSGSSIVVCSGVTVNWFPA